jgi:hypothetical protein
VGRWSCGMIAVPENVDGVDEVGPWRSEAREWVAGLKAGGVKPPTIRSCFVVLSAVFTTALNDQVTFLHPCKGVKSPPVPAHSTKRFHKMVGDERL